MMLRQRENPESVKAGVFSVLVHVMLLGALLISFNWKTTHPISIAQVELWDSVPAPQQKPVLPPEPDLPPPVEKALPKPESVPEPVAEPILKPEPQVEIAIEKKPLKKEPLKSVNKTNDALAKLQEEARQDALKNKNTAKPDVSEALKKLQQESLTEDRTPGEQKSTAAKSSATAGVVDEFKAKIQAKIRSHVNKTLCGDGNPELKFEIGLIPTGELSSAPKLVKSSGNTTCDDAVERAIRMSEPLPLPQDANLFSQFRNLKLTFRPNDS